MQLANYYTDVNINWHAVIIKTSVLTVTAIYKILIVAHKGNHYGIIIA